MIAVVTDSTCDLPERLLNPYDIRIVPSYVNIGERSLRDGIDITRRDFYAKLSLDGERLTTSAPAPGEFVAVYDNLLTQASHVVSIHLASQLSGIYASATVAAGQVDASRITVLDSGQISMALGWAALAAAKAAQNGESVEGVLHSANNVLSKVKLFALLDTLAYLARSGRVDFVRAGLSSLLNIKPILEVKAGNISPIERVRTWSRAIEALKLMVMRGSPLQSVAVMHTNIEEEASTFREEIGKATQPLEEILIANVAPTIGVHTGPKTLAVAFIPAG